MKLQLLWSRDGREGNEGVRRRDGPQLCIFALFATSRDH
jgi:hypothetical protein